jgi:hypothetical protein
LELGDAPRRRCRRAATRRSARALGSDDQKDYDRRERQQDRAHVTAQAEKAREHAVRDSWRDRRFAAYADALHALDAAWRAVVPLADERKGQELVLMEELVAAKWREEVPGRLTALAIVGTDEAEKAAERYWTRIHTYAAQMAVDMSNEAQGWAVKVEPLQTTLTAVPDARTAFLAVTKRDLGTDT